MSRRSGNLLAALALVAIGACTAASALAYGGGGGRGGFGAAFAGHGWAGHGWAGHGWNGHGFGGRGWYFHQVGGFHGPAVPGYAGYYESSAYVPGCVWVRQLSPGPYGPVWRYYPACYYGF